MSEVHDFGAQLRRHRQTAGLTIEALADASGVSVRGISDMERGRSRGPQMRTVEALLDALRLQGSDRAQALAAAGAGRDRGRAGPAAPVLPGDDFGFVGRTNELHRITDAVAVSGPSRPLVVISGTAGLGKTSLAVRAARDLAGRLEHRAVFVPMEGNGATPLGAAEAAVIVLRATGHPDADIPADATRRLGLLTHVLAERRCLLVLDDARDEAQVRPLIAHAVGAPVLVTSRRSLSGLTATDRIVLDPMTADDAATMLSDILGSEYPHSHKGLAELASVCGRFPLALRIAGNRLLSRPGWSVQTMIERLTDDALRLGRLTAGDLQIMSTFTVSYDQLHPVQRRVFRRMALIAGATWSAESAGLLTDLPANEADLVLDELVELGLVGTDADQRYFFHDLIRVFAADRLRNDDTAREIETAHVRHTNWIIATAADAGRLFEPVRPGAAAPHRSLIGDHELAERWLQTERDNWLAALRDAARSEAHYTVLDLADSMHWVSDRQPFWTGWADVFGLARDAARQLADLHSEAVHTGYLSWYYTRCLGDPTTGFDLAVTALDLARRAGAVDQQAWAQYYAADALMYSDRFTEALDFADRATTLFDQAGEVNGLPQSSILAANVLRFLQRPTEALARMEEVLAFLDAHVDAMTPTIADFVRVNALHLSAKAFADLADLPAADGRCEAALTVARRSGLSLLQADVLRTQAGLFLKSDTPKRRLAALTQARDLYRAHGDEQQAAAMNDQIALVEREP